MSYAMRYLYRAPRSSGDMVPTKKPRTVRGFFVGGFWGRRGYGGGTPFLPRAKGVPPRVPLCQNLQPTLMHARPAVDTGRRVAFEVGNEDQRDAAGGQLVQQIQILAAGVFVQGGTGLVQQ